MWERFFNWQSDMDWTWGPFLSLRPPRNQAIRPWVWVQLFFILSVFGAVFVGLFALLIWQLPIIAATGHRPLPQSILETVSTLRGMYGDPGTEAVLIGLIFILPPLFFLFCLPYHKAWNRRSARLEKSEMPAGTAPGVWPPAPG